MPMPLTRYKEGGKSQHLTTTQTYIYPISDIRAEGNGPILADAIDGLANGSVPRIAVYKKQVVWGEKVKAYLRGEVELDD